MLKGANHRTPQGTMKSDCYYQKYKRQNPIPAHFIPVKGFLAKYRVRAGS
jgi:hypothetical protein